MSSETEGKQRKAERAKVGRVTSISGSKSIRVAIETLVKHPQYGKYIRRRTKVAAHDETNAAGLGDLVEIVPCRRLSKSKSWRLLRVVREATIATRAAVEKG